LNGTKEASPATARFARHTTEKYSLLFSFCARRISFSPNEKSVFLWCLALKSKVAELACIFCEGKAEFPPHPPSAMPSLGRTGFFAATFLPPFLSCSLFDGFNKPSLTIPLRRCFLWHNFG